MPEKKEESFAKIDQKLLGKIAARLKKLRIDKGFTNYEHFANESGISRTQYGKYETGENLKLLTLAKILRHLDISLKDFFAEGFED
ncbi:Helix-turn-helix [Pedobacter terrae]|uniref:Helix-turn-helix n=1 Tax=Pedobacter terrae TaxID=405671 RepID=A0A1G7Q4R4_9SPHI|nr:helix-turn-helix transcriptional regulator [Pedobacter terrae]SDF93577.1 Helix-turn-helix [Pedobacter terrae]